MRLLRPSCSCTHSGCCMMASCVVTSSAALALRESAPPSRRARAVKKAVELVPSAGGETGFKGVYKDGGKYKAQITENGKLRHLGNFAAVWH